MLNNFIEESGKQGLVLEWILSRCRDNEINDHFYVEVGGLKQG